MNEQGAVLGSKPLVDCMNRVSSTNRVAASHDQVVQSLSEILLELRDCSLGDRGISVFGINLVYGTKRDRLEIAVLLRAVKRIAVNDSPVHKLAVSAEGSCGELEHAPICEVLPESRPCRRWDVMGFIDQKRINA